MEAILSRVALFAKGKKLGGHGKGSMQISRVLFGSCRGRPGIVKALRCIPSMFGEDIDFAFLIHQWFFGLPNALFADIANH